MRRLDENVWRYCRYDDSLRGELSRTFGGIDRDIEQTFLNFGTDDLRVLFEVYEARFGREAAAYARSTHPKWKSGYVRMSGKVAERLLGLVPPLLSLETRFELVKKLRAAHFRKLDRFVTTTPSTWRAAVVPVIKEVVENGRSSMLSEEVKRRAAWLADGDSAASEKMLLAAEEAEAVTRLGYLQAEFSRLDQLVGQMPDCDASIHHIIELPQGSISVTIEVPRVSAWQKLSKWMGIT